jgi:hypothetical protein
MKCSKRRALEQVLGLHFLSASGRVQGHRIEPKDTSYRPKDSIRLRRPEKASRAKICIS